MNLFKLPTPKEMNVSESNSLMSRKLTPDQIGYSWEDYDADCKNLYPVRYWSNELFGFIYFNVICTIKRFYFDIKSKYYDKHHLLDLRQPKSSSFNDDTYEFGYLDIPEKMTYAIFNILAEFVKETEDLNPKDYGEDDQLYVNALLEARHIHFWWLIDRKNDLRIL